MSEQLNQPVGLQHEAALSNQEYLESLGQARTTRHASEEYHSSPNPEVTSAAVRDIRKDIANVFKEVPDSPPEVSHETLGELKARYWQRASQVGVEVGAISGYDLEDYMRVGKGRSYDEIKDTIEHEYPEDSIPRHVLDGIDAYHKALQLNPAHAATIIMELISRNLKTIEQRATEISNASDPEAVNVAFAEFITREVPSHVRFIADEYGIGDNAVHSNMYRKSFYLTADVEAEQPVALTLTEQDATGLVEVYDIQSRPYDRDALDAGNDIAQLPEMQAAMLRIHEELVATSRRYLDAHPERAVGNLENFSEIFIPMYTEEGTIDDLLPNPKLVRAMVNNVMPAIALALRRQDRDLLSLGQSDVDEGVRIAAQEYRLFQTRIGQFDNYDDERRTVDLLSTFHIVCPANSIFPKYLSAKLAPYFEDEKSRVRYN